MPRQEASAHEPEGAGTTRDRILDIALDLFLEKGFDKTSLREIAERLGFSKAAIYYHFASKDEILMALHLRLHDIGNRAFERLGDGPVNIAVWRGLLEEMVGEMLANREIFVMYDRNRAAFENLHRESHDAAHDDLDGHLRRMVADRSLPVRDRVRMACGVGALLTGLLLFGELLEDVSTDEFAEILRSAVRDVVAPERTVRPRRTGAR